MARHSKWAQIKRQKAVVDAKRGKEFTKLIRHIISAAREGGVDLSANPSLRDAIERARAANMPRDNIDRALSRVAETSATGNTKIVEAYGPAGVALLIEVMTDNHNRTVAALRHLLSEHGGALAEAGSVLWQFSRQGIITLAASDKAEAIELAVIDAGAVDSRYEVGGLVIVCRVEDKSRLEDIIRLHGADIVSAKMTYVPTHTLELADNSRQQLHNLLHALDEEDDVVGVITNLKS